MKTQFQTPKAYNVKLRSDGGIVTIQTTGDSCHLAVQTVLNSEKAPRSAILSVHRVHCDGRTEFMSHDLF